MSKIKKLTTAAFLCVIILCSLFTACSTHEHSYTQGSDEDCHYSMCSCGDIKDKEPHSFVWKIDSVAQKTQDGAKHRECEVCGFRTDENTVIQKPQGKFYKLSEAYEKKLIDREDLLNIAYYYNGKVNINDSGFVPEKTEDKLSDKTLEDMIKATHLNRIVYDTPAADIGGISVSGYFGTYNGCVVVIMRDYYNIVDPIITEEYVIDDVKFSKFADGYPAGVEIWVKE